MVVDLLKDRGESLPTRVPVRWPEGGEGAGEGLPPREDAARVDRQREGPLAVLARAGRPSLAERLCKGRRLRPKLRSGEAVCEWLARQDVGWLKLPGTRRACVAIANAGRLQEAPLSRGSCILTRVSGLSMSMSPMIPPPLLRVEHHRCLGCEEWPLSIPSSSPTRSALVGTPSQRAPHVLDLQPHMRTRPVKDTRCGARQARCTRDGETAWTKQAGELASKQTHDAF